MDDMTRFGSGIGWGDGDGSGDGSGCGDGDGDGSGDGSGDGDGDGWGDGGGSGIGWGYGDGRGSGDGSGIGYGWGDGSGYGSGIIERELIFIKELRGQRPVNIDGLLTVFDRRVTANIMRGYILRDDWTFARTFVARQGDKYAHGETARQALRELQNKIFADLDFEELAKKFCDAFKAGKPYPAMDFYKWHGFLTGSCEQGRQEFAAGRGIDLQNDTLTAEQFFEIVKGAYGWGKIEGLAAEFR
jgi:hypothetical protein